MGEGTNNPIFLGKDPLVRFQSRSSTFRSTNLPIRQWMGCDVTDTVVVVVVVWSVDLSLLFSKITDCQTRGDTGSSPVRLKVGVALRDQVSPEERRSPRS